MSAVVHPAFAAREAFRRATTWWGRSWVRAVEESAYAERDLVAARALSRSGHVGGITTDAGRFVAAVEDGEGMWTVSGTVPVLDEQAGTVLVETVAAETGRIASLLAGELPHALVEHAEESGVELLPYGGELATDCTCSSWVDPCVHALAVLSQLTWLVEADPFVLLQLRGLPRDDLLARLHAGAVEEPEAVDDLDTGLDAALRAAALLRLVEDPDQPLDHLF